MELISYNATVPSIIEGPRTSLLGFFLLLILSSVIMEYAVRAYNEYCENKTLALRHGCSPPPELPNRWPLGIDHLRDMWAANSKAHFLQYFSGLADNYEARPTFSQFFLGGPRQFHLLDPRNVEAVLHTNYKDYSFGTRRSVLAPLLGDGIFTQEGAKWKHSRELLRRHFAQKKSQRHDRFREHVDNLIARLPFDGVVDLQPLFFSLTLDTSTALLLEESVYSLIENADRDSRSEEFARSFGIAQEGLAKRFQMAPWHFLYSPKEFREACGTTHRFVDDYVKSRTAKDEAESSSESYEFFNRLAEESATEKGLRDQLLNILLAGRDTTACCLSWTFRLLVRHPDVLRRLRTEIRSVVPGMDGPTREQIRNMPYLNYVIKESLRLYPPVPINNRRAIQTTILPVGGGHDGKSPILVRKGEVVVFSQYCISRRKNIYGADADKFRPERWGTDELAGIGRAFSPFNSGPRQCLGEDFAMLEIAYTVVRLLLACDEICLPDGEEAEELGTERQILTMVLMSADGCRVKMKRAQGKAE